MMNERSKKKNTVLPKLRTEDTKNQIKRFLENAVKNAQNPDPRELMRKKRKEKANKIAKKYGF